MNTLKVVGEIWQSSSLRSVEGTGSWLQTSRPLLSESGGRDQLRLACTLGKLYWNAIGVYNALKAAKANIIKQNHLFQSCLISMLSSESSNCLRLIDILSSLTNSWPLSNYWHCNPFRLNIYKTSQLLISLNITKPTKG